MGVCKAALESSVKYLARDLGAKGMRVNAISAGPIKTLAASAIGDAKFLYKWNEDHSFLKRNVDIHDVGNSALYLLSDLAKGVTGEIHYVDAGYNKVGMPDPKNITWKIKDYGNSYIVNLFNIYCLLLISTHLKERKRPI